MQPNHLYVSRARRTPCTRSDHSANDAPTAERTGPTVPRVDPSVQVSLIRRLEKMDLSDFDTKHVNDAVDKFDCRRVFLVYIYLRFNYRGPRKNRIHTNLKPSLHYYDIQLFYITN